MNGFTERLAKKMEHLVSDNTNVEITAANVDRSMLAW